MKKFLLILPLLLILGCASGSYLDRLGNALLDRTPKLGQDISENPSPVGVGIALFEWIAGALAVAGTGTAGVVAVKKVRKSRARKAASLLSPTSVDPPLPLPPASEPTP